MRAAKAILLVAGAAVVAVGVMGSTATARTKSSTRQHQTIRIAFFGASLANSFNQASYIGVKDAAKKYGNVTVTAFDGKFDPTVQTNQLRDALVTKRFQGWIINPANGIVIVPEIEKAISQGVKVACLGNPCGKDPTKLALQIPGLTAVIFIPYYQNGQLLGRLTVKACAGKNPCEVFWMPGTPSLPFEQVRTRGYKSVLRTHKNIKIVSIQGGGYLPGPGLTAMQNVLQAHPNLSIVASSGDQMIVGAYRAAQAAGKASQIKFMSNGGTADAIKALKAGQWYASIPFAPRTEGTVSFGMVIRAIKGQKVQPRAIDTTTLPGIPAILTKANAGTWKPQF